MCTLATFTFLPFLVSGILKLPSLVPKTSNRKRDHSSRMMMQRPKVMERKKIEAEGESWL
jgi:hypothetical protein